MDLARETITDLLRSGWVIEAARSALYKDWASHEPDLSARADNAARRAELLEAALADLGRSPDTAIVEAHRGWIQSLAGDEPREVALGNLFVARLGDWVDAHTERFLGERGPQLRELGDRERALLRFPDDLPTPPPFEPLESPEVEPPGEVLFRFAILGDLHFGSPKGEERARAAIADVNASGAELVIQLGDLTDHGLRAEFDLAVKVLAELDIPCTTMMGNHDILSRDDQKLAGRSFYGSTFGREPDGVLLEHKGFRFAVLDSATEAASPFGPFDFITGAFTDGSGGAVVHGSLTVPQHDILADVAAPRTAPAFVFLHHPPQPFAGFPPILFGLREADSGRLHATADSG
ncbi:MAG: metallophosphoesterase family protein, partial [Actinomycetota bacterium]